MSPLRSRAQYGRRGSGPGVAPKAIRAASIPTALFVDVGVRSARLERTGSEPGPCRFIETRFELSGKPEQPSGGVRVVDQPRQLAAIVDRHLQLLEKLVRHLRSKQQLR